jgi:hypothetical protein
VNPWGRGEITWGTGPNLDVRGAPGDARRDGDDERFEIEPKLRLCKLFKVIEAAPIRFVAARYEREVVGCVLAVARREGLGAWSRDSSVAILNRPVPHYVAGLVTRGGPGSRRIAELVSGVLCIPVEERGNTRSTLLRVWGQSANLQRTATAKIRTARANAL